MTKFKSEAEIEKEKRDDEIGKNSLPPLLREHLSSVQQKNQREIAVSRARR